MEIVYISIAIFVAITIWIIVIFVLIMTKWNKNQKIRDDNIQKFASLNNFTYYLEESENNELEIKKDFSVFNIGSKKKVSNILSNENYIYFDYQYLISNGKSSTLVLLNIVQVKLKNNLPDFTLENENVFHKIGQVFGYQDIDFKTNYNFSKKYLLRGKDESEIKGYFNIERLKFFENFNLAGKIEIKNSYLNYIVTQVKFDDYEKFINNTKLIVENLDK